MAAPPPPARINSSRMEACTARPLIVQGHVEQAGRGRNDAQAIGRTGRLGHDRRIGRVAALDGRAGPGLGVHHLLAHDVLDDDVAVGVQAGLQHGLQRDQRGGVAALHVAGATAPDLAVDDLAAPRPGLGPVGVRSWRHHVHVAVEEQRPPAARAAELAGKVRAALLRFPQVGRQADILHERLAELVDARLATARRLLIDARIGRVYRRDADGVDGHLDEVIGQRIHLGQYTLAGLGLGHRGDSSARLLAGRMVGANRTGAR